MKLAEDVHLIKCPFSRYFTSVCAIISEEIVLIDSGVPSSPNEAILPYLDGVGRRPEEIAYVILTHGHFDHCGGAALLKKHFSTKVVVHELDRPLVEDALLIDKQLYGRFGAPPVPKKAPFQSVKADITIKEGDSLDVAGRELTFLHLPGHSPGSMAVIDPEIGLYVAGDSPQGRGAGRPLLFHSSTDYEASMKRLSSEPMSILVLGHPFPPLERPVLEGEEARLHALESLRAARELAVNLQTALSEAKRPSTLDEIQAGLPGAQSASVGCVLEALVREGKAKELRMGGRPLWMPAA